MQSVKEASAGGLVIRRDARGHIDLLLIQQRGHKGWGFPKGWIEPGESPEQTAVREVEEESGVRAEIICPLPSTRYFYVNREKRRVAKTVYWFLMKYVGEGDQTHAHEVVAVEWLPLEQVHGRLSFPNDKELFSVAIGDILKAEV